jgi:hypothetical protein
VLKYDEPRILVLEHSLCYTKFILKFKLIENKERAQLDAQQRQIKTMKGDIINPTSLLE